MSQKSRKNAILLLCGEKLVRTPRETVEALTPYVATLDATTKHRLPYVHPLSAYDRAKDLLATLSQEPEAEREDALREARRAGQREVIETVKKSWDQGGSIFHVFDALLAFKTDESGLRTLFDVTTQMEALPIFTGEGLHDGDGTYLVDGWSLLKKDDVLSVLSGTWEPPSPETNVLNL